MVTRMREILGASFVLTCTTIILGAQAALAQSPPAAQRDVPIWSDRDLSLHPDGRPASSEMDPPETGLLLPHSGLFDPRPGDVLLCEPGEYGLLGSPAVAYAQIRKPQNQQAR